MFNYGFFHINNVIEDLEELQEAISEDGKILDVQKYLIAAKQIPKALEQAYQARDYMKEMQQVECKCEIDQMKEIGMSQSNFI